MGVGVGSEVALTVCVGVVDMGVSADDTVVTVDALTLGGVGVVDMGCVTVSGCQCVGNHSVLVGVTRFHPHSHIFPHTWSDTTMSASSACADLQIFDT